MAATHHLLTLQKELFDPLKERVLFLVECENAEKKSCSLCCLSDSEEKSRSLNLSLCEVRNTKKKHSWPLTELCVLDAISVESKEFVLGFDKTSFAYQADQIEEKNNFLRNLINLSSQHLGNFAIKNYPHQPVSTKSLKPDGLSKNNGENGDGGEDVYKAMTGKEISDLMSLMSKCEHAVTNADVFIEDLNRELNVLDSANVYSIMANQENMDNLMNLIDVSIKETEYLEAKLNQYDDQLEHIRDSMDKMEGKTVSIETVNTNNKKLLKSLEEIIEPLDLPYQYQHILTESDFTTPGNIKLCIEAAHALKVALDESSKDPNYYKLKAVTDQSKRCIKLRDRFSKSICRHLNNLFIHLGNETGGDLEGASGQLKLTIRRCIHKDLIKYSELVHWLEEMDHKIFIHLQTTYRSSLSKLYEKDLKRFLDLARIRISGGRANVSIGSTTDINAALGKDNSKAGGSIKKGLLGTAETDSISSEYSLSERERFDDVLETMLQELETICQDEQNFSIQFFKMNKISSGGKDKKATEEARRMMSEIFPVLEGDLLAFISYYERTDNFFTMQALVRMGKHVLSAEDKGSFLAISLGSVLIQVKRNFDKFMNSHLTSIRDSRSPKKSKCGILPFITNFEGFVVTAESVFKTTERRSDLDKWYGTLLNEMMNSIVRLSFEHSKTPSDVVQMENFHRLQALLSSLKIPSLEQLKKDAKSKYNEALTNYVTRYFGRPLEKLNAFVDGIQSLLSAGVKETEIGYQLAYNKQVLRKVIAHYPAKDVKKGLENLYKKVERHLSEESNLLQVVWRAMQNEFITQYKCIEDLITKCYPGSQITLDFNIDDLLNFFSDIARSH
ncbi:exocyst complex component 1 [Lepeophtheirus salmonis]|uniref:Exocyst complex component Sec3 PIP2-binding N-terminal domain-containing protein n=1 Tax=Lepeophtheirus salmonis TaxID=72036 RepID=A0A0K2V3C5_LEPSM|nr:exocyst complex component 1-like [Lepeophtheirus salmonis]